MKHKNKPEEQKQTEPKNAGADADNLLAALLATKDEQFEDVFLTKDDQQLIESLPDEQKAAVREAMLSKGVLFKKLLEKLQRLSADYSNFQKRVPKQIADTVVYEHEKVIRTLLPALDNFELTLKNAESAKNAEAIIKGVKIIYDQMLDILKSHGAEQIKALGEKFDPVMHQAMLHQARPEQAENVVLEEFQRGYKLNGRVIRPSRVVINKLPSSQAEVQELPTEEVQKEEQSSGQPSEECETKDTEQ
jgi:molecular chaperone GrpE